MLFKTFLPTVALVASASAASLSDVLTAQNSSLSTLNSLLASNPDIVKVLDNASNITVLAPSNDALSKFLANPSNTAAVVSDPSLINALLSYHVINGTWYNTSFTNTSVFLPTWLSNSSYANVTGGQVVEAALDNNNVTFWSALKQNTTISTPNLNFTGGTLHIVDSVLSIPGDLNSTLVAANLTSADGALAKAGTDLTSQLAGLKNVTVFVPSNSAFAAIANIAANWSNTQVEDILKYHIVDGTVDYSTLVQNNTQADTLGGGKLSFTVDNGTIFVDSARIIEKDVLINNGVLHVIDGVLNPQNTTAKPNTSGTTDAPAFTGATAGTNSVPFTSGVPTPTTTVPAATAASSSKSSGLAMPLQTGAAGYAALFGGAAILMNM
ncbi:hypothetical protein SEUCBS140593_008205 [Sporothrix eucalyptigena]|uniref:FAS1 domain-containing protein n=1 Tax=Sporothrix eucalyptigena TaxID=1812306 RepID=A0ABP0CJI8_9PEZI